MTTHRFFHLMLLLLLIAVVPCGTSVSYAVPTLTPGVDYTKPNYAYSPPLRKFVDRLPGLTAAGINNLNQYIPLATAGKFPGLPNDDYYEIGLVEYTERMHRDLPNVTKFRGYVQLVAAGTTGAVPLTVANGLTRDVKDSQGNQLYGADRPHYLGPLILATRNVPVRIKFTNLLPTGAPGKLFLPVDTTIMGAGPYQIGDLAVPSSLKSGNFTDNRATLHLHGGLPGWESDGTAHQWITPAGENPDYSKGMSVQNVPDMPVPADGSMYFHWPNQQSGRLLFYHDHALGITAANVYAGEAAGYLLVEPAQETALAAAGVPGTITATPDLGHLIPLIIQDKSFVPDTTTLAATDPLWDVANWGGPGNLWLPHVYMPNQDPNDSSGSNPLGRWDYGPWFWPPWPVSPGSTPPVNSHIPESFMDTPVVNGTAYPYVDVQPQAYRLKILNASGDRFYNLQLYIADPNGYAIDTTGNPVTPGTGFGTEVLHVPAMLNPAIPFPTSWKARTPGMIPDILDFRQSGVPHPDTRGPAMIQIGTEGGLLPTPAVLNNIPVGYEQNKRNIVVLNVLEKTLFLAPAERADVIVDFSKFAGKTVILYNDSPAPVPAGDPRNDFYTGNLDFSATSPDNNQGGAPSTLPGYGPNTRTILQFRVAAPEGSDSSAPVDYINPTLLASLESALPVIYNQTQEPIIIPQPIYPVASGGHSAAKTLARIQDTQLTFTPPGASSPVTQQMLPKAIHELFDPIGRMNSVLGVELPFTNGRVQTTIPYGYVDPTTETLADGETQIWKITHNGVDSHGIHFHLLNMQVINRVGWDGAIRETDPNELGWKDTIRMNPLEDIIVAAKAKSVKLPYGLPDSIRPMDVTMPIGSLANFANIDPLTGFPLVITNAKVNFGWEYTWHCHLLGHEENDMMRPMVLNVTSVKPAASNLTASVISGASPSITLTWVDPTPPVPVNLGNPANEIGFKIYRCTSNCSNVNNFTMINTAPANTTTYVDPNVTTGTTYSYIVYAFNAAGTSAASNIAASSQNIVSAPTNVTASLSNGGSGILVRWTASNTSGATYTIIATRPDGNPVVFSNVTGTSKTLTTLSSDTYTISIRADKNGFTSSTTVTVATPLSITGLVEAPAWVGAALANGGADISVWWPASDTLGATYTVTAKPASGASTAVSGITGTSTILTGLANGTYTITVRADSAGFTSSAAVSAAASLIINKTVADPVWVDATIFNMNSISVFWAGSSTAGVTYTVTATPAVGAPVVVTGITGTSTSLTNLPNGTYTITVQGFKSGFISSAAVASVNGTLTVQGVVAAPAWLGASLANGGADIFVWWPALAIPGVTYTVTATPTVGTPTVASGLTGTSITLPDVPNGIYTVTIQAFKSGFINSAIITAATPLTVNKAVAAPAWVTATLVNNGSDINVLWPSSTTTGVTYTVTATPSLGTATVISGITGTSTNLTGLPNGTYTITVQALRTSWISSAVTAAAGPVIINKTAPAPAYLGVQRAGANGIKLWWPTSALAGAGYTITQTSGPGTGATVTTGFLTSGSLKYIILTGKTPGTYSYSIKTTAGGYNDSAATAGSASVTIP